MRWWDAETLTERAPAVQPGLATHGHSRNPLADFRLERWRSQPPFSNGPYFQDRLAQIGLTEDELRSLLEAAEPAAKTEVPKWLVTIERNFGQDAKRHDSRGGAAQGTAGSDAFLALIEPLLEEGRQLLVSGIKRLVVDYQPLPVSSGTLEQKLYADLQLSALRIINRACVLELNLARLEGTLDGESSEKRFLQFLDRLSDRRAGFELLSNYPVLARSIVGLVERWLSANIEWIGRLISDWQLVLGELAGGQHPGDLVVVNAAAGDRHRSGRCTVILGFSTGFFLVYKPRSMAVDVHFQELISWINRYGQEPPLRPITVLDRGSYGWAEFAHHLPCHTAAEVRRFYERQGSYLAILHALGGTDFHRENLIASGEHPIMVDLETLFHPMVSHVQGAASGDLRLQALSSSVLRVGFLPSRIWGSEVNEGIDLSGLTGDENQITPFGVPQWQDFGTDSMRLIRREVAIPPTINRPKLDGSAADVLDYSDDFELGFVRTYRILTQHREALLSEDGPLAAFKDDEVRVVLRPTRTYGALLQESFHPDFLRDALERDRLFDLLWSSVPRAPHLVATIPAEQKDLNAGDVPIFTTYPSSCHLWSSSGQRIEEYFRHPSMSSIRKRLEEFSEGDLGRQIWFVRASFATASSAARPLRVRRPSLVEPIVAYDRARALDLARRVGDRLFDLAYESDDEASWIGLTVTARDQWVLEPLGQDLYGGMSGIALFLAYLGDLTSDERYSVLARKAIRSADHCLPKRALIGGFDGWGSLIYAKCHLGVLWNAPELVEEAEAIGGRLGPLIDQDSVFDVIGGAAGCIGSLLCLQQCKSSNGTLALAVRAGERLLDTANKLSSGLGWTNSHISSEPLAGFSHGASGIAWALLLLATETGRQEFRSAAMSAIEYERALFSVTAENWPDLRVHDKSQDVDRPRRYVTAWCHGAPGIGLARLAVLDQLDDVAHTEIRTAVDTTIRNGFGQNHSLCHGDFGNLELLSAAGQRIGYPLKPVIEAIEARLLEDIHTSGWRCGIPLGAEFLG